MKVNYDRIKDDRRFNEYGIPKNKTKSSAKKDAAVNSVPNGNYLWINLFATSLKPTGRAALVMANSASDARNSEADIRKQLINNNVIDCMLTLPKNMFYTVTLPATLWFFNKAKGKKEQRILFIDARNIFRQVTRALREFTDEHIQNIAVISYLFRGENYRLKELLNRYKSSSVEYEKLAQQQKKVLDKLIGGNLSKDKRTEKQEDEASKKYKELLDKQKYFLAQIDWLNERFPNGVYEDVTGLCKAATLAEIEEQDFSLNPGRYVGVVIEEDGLTEEEFISEMKERHRALNELNEKGQIIEKMIIKNFLNFS